MLFIQACETGQLLTGSLMDYALPRADDFPPPVVELHVVPSTTNPLGVKGCGESGVTGSLSAVVNAVHDALRRAGVEEDVKMPFTAEKIWRALRAAKRPLI